MGPWDLSEGAQAVVRAVSLLRHVAMAGEPGARLVELAKLSALHSATAHRILRAMTAEGILAYDPKRKRYFTGPEIFRLASAGMGGALRRRFHPVLERVAGRTGLSAYLSVREGSEVVCIDSVVGNAIVQVVPYTIGSRRPLGVGAAGLALLAALPEAEVAEMLEAQFAGKAQGTLPPGKLRRMLAEGRKNRFTYNPGLFIRGVGGLGIPVTCREVGLACLSVVGLESRFSPAAERKGIAGILEAEAAGAAASPIWPRTAPASGNGLGQPSAPFAGVARTGKRTGQDRT